MVEDTRNALQGVRRSLIELYASMGADPGSPQDISRKYGVNRNLTWKLSKVINAPSPFASLNHLPGQQGLELAVGAFENAGAPKPAVEQVRAAMKHFLAVVESHAGDREHLELTLESMGVFERESTGDTGRELAFRGNSAVWGVQARTRVTAAFLAPSSLGADTHSVAFVSGLVGFRRLRPNVEWRLFRSQAHDDRGGELSGGREELEPKRPGDQPLLIKEFSSANMPPLSYMDTPAGREFYLPSGEVGNRAVFDCFYGYVMHGLPAYRTPDDSVGSFAVPITLPAENLIFDIIYHREIPIGETVEALLYGFPHGGPDDVTEQTIRNQLPLSEKPSELAGSPPAVATPLAPVLHRIAERVYARMRWNPADFRGIRLHVPHPPMSSRVVLRWKLSERPQA
ncbi:MAG TPA: hypothetical protein VD997_03825 [Phycisphaerales bacterium]|nr:hypothetical protein [Phycisphaerales bacterium]